MAEGLQALHVVTSHAFGLKTVEKVATEFSVGRVVFQHIPSDAIRRTSASTDSFLPAPEDIEK